MFSISYVTTEGERKYLCNLFLWKTEINLGLRMTKTLTFSRSSKSQKKGDNAPTSRACVPMDIKWLRILVISPNRAIKDQRRPWQYRVILCAKGGTVHEHNDIRQETYFGYIWLWLVHQCWVTFPRLGSKLVHYTSLKHSPVYQSMARPERKPKHSLLLMVTLKTFTLKSYTMPIKCCHPQTQEVFSL